MHRKLILLSAAAFFTLAQIPFEGVVDMALAKSSISPPKALKKSKKLTNHGHTRVDPYYWLKNRKNKSVLAYLEAENTYAKKQMKHTATLQKRLFSEMKSRIKKDDSTVPYFKNGYYYYSKKAKGKEYSTYCRKKGGVKSKEEILLDVNVLAKGHDYYDLGALSVSDDNKTLMFSVDDVGRYKYRIEFKDLTSGKFLKDKISNTSGELVWAADNRTVFYVHKDEKTLRAYKAMRHLLGTPVKKDVEVYSEEDTTFDIYLYKTKSQKYIGLGVTSTLSCEHRFIESKKPTSKPKVFSRREKKHEYYVDHNGDKFYVMTNWKAKNSRIMVTHESATAKKNWKQYVRHRSEVLITDIEMFEKYLVVKERKAGLQQIRVIELENRKNDYYINFGEAAYATYTTGNRDFTSSTLRFGYESMTTPESIFDYDLKRKRKKLLKEKAVLGGFDRKNYKTERFFIRARDGVKIPISLVYKKGFKKDGKSPLLLYAYGSYGSSSDPYFDSDRISLLDRGFVYAIAHVRGGQELGRHWYDDGKLLKKKNTFNDFIDCGEALIEKKYAAKNKLFIKGLSAGGLLVGAVLNMRPELFRGAIASVPFVDVVTTMLDESIPLTTFEYDEWGNPSDKKYYEYMLSYSPYDNVEKKDYPATLVLTSLHDSQVQYWEPAKWVAKLRDLKTDSNMLLLKTDMAAGHGGKTGRFKYLHDVALQYAFLIDLALGRNSAAK